MLQFADILVVASIATISPAKDAVVHVGAAGAAVQPPVKLEWSGTRAADGTFAETLLAVKPEGGERQVFSITNAAEAYITNLELGRRYSWGVVVPGFGKGSASSFETALEPPRLLRVEGLANFRDLGGWVGLGGRRVRQNMLFRSAGLRAGARRKGGSALSPVYEPGAANVTGPGLEYMRSEFRIRTDIELRQREEAVLMQDSLLGDGVSWLKVPFPAGASIDDIVKGREPFMRIFRRLLREDAYPAIFHCSDGCERTGTLALLLNGLLGVSEEDLRRDWDFSSPALGLPSAGAESMEALLAYLHSVGGEDVRECCEVFARGCGVSDAEIEAFRAIMLEGGRG